MSGVRPVRSLAAPLSVSGFREKVGDAIWLYLYLVVSANHGGIVLRQLDRLTSDLLVEASEIESWLSRLQRTRLVDVVSPAPYLAIKLRSWSGDAAHQSENPSEHATQSIDPLSVPVGSSNAAAAASREKRGLGEGEELLRHVLSVLGESDEAEFRAILKQHPEERVRQALSRVQATPPEQIRKSKAALFRFLLNKLS